jgi:integrase
MSRSMAQNGETLEKERKEEDPQMRISRDGRGETWLTDAQKDQILKLAQAVPRDHLLLGLQLERGWRIGSIVGCHNTVTYTKKRTGEKMVCVVDLPGIRKEDVGPDTITVHFKGGKIEADYPGKKWLRLAQKLASKAQNGERIIPLTEQHGTNILRKYAKLAGVPNWDRLHNHRQRAYFGTFWARKTGRDPWKVQSLMGHRDLRATEVYVKRLSLEEKKQLLDAS